MSKNLCGYSKEEIINSLNIIKKICDKNSCENCPFSLYNGDVCKIKRNIPEDWILNGITSVDNWEAFY